MTVPSHAALDRTLAALREGYEFLPRRRQRWGSDLFETRLLGQRVVCMAGPEAARVFYDGERFERRNALPGRIQKTLMGRGGVQTLDGEAHARRKALFLSLMTPGSLAGLRAAATEAWAEAVERWERADRVVLFDEASRVLCRAACTWAGVPLPEDEVPATASDLVAMVDGFGTIGVPHWAARRARRRAERRFAEVVRRVRAGELPASAGTAARAVAEHRDADGRPLDERLAAVELLNVVRPTTAVAWYVADAAHALHTHLAWRDRLRSGSDDDLELFVQEVRRFYPFTPFLGARVRRDFTWRGHRFPEGRLVLLDVYGDDHDPARWERPHEFDPDRFAGRVPGPYDFIPQGGGDPATGHRCAGEPVVLDLTKAAAAFLAIAVDYRVPEQDLTIPLGRIPTRPRSGMVIADVHRVREHAA